ncbi:hypothetical protein GFY24_34260 [Nocardia sp. SYP-A9097]|uniref:hypothetical protein n=1 Tax=Nocardia sp. SYP-A9097 TaxID=2663237 RepID=UPI00129B83D2|nr:hypothetical protein [Nocardia sp. SYP-A9097]MRH92430.1 hypothetical protein [Nocardia sp. SYP-A9097]
MEIGRPTICPHPATLFCHALGVLGIYGYGRIGRTVAGYGAAFGMPVLFCAGTDFGISCATVYSYLRSPLASAMLIR